VLFDLAVFERGTAVHAVRMQQADAAAAVAKAHQFLAHDLQEARCVREFQRHAHWVPEAAHVLAQRRARAGFGDFGVVPGHAVAEVAAIGNELLLGGGVRRWKVLVAGVHGGGGLQAGENGVGWLLNSVYRILRRHLVQNSAGKPARCRAESFGLLAWRPDGLSARLRQPPRASARAAAPTSSGPP